VLKRAAEAIFGVHREVAVGAGQLGHKFVRPHVELIVRRDFAIVLERFAATRLLVRRRKWNVTDFQQLWRSEERHVRWVVEERVRKAAFVYDYDIAADVLGVDGAGETSGSRANDEHIVKRLFAHSSDCMDERKGRKDAALSQMHRSQDLRVDVDQLVADSKERKLQARADAGLVEDIRQVALHGLFADCELLGDVLV
jgi:hypothetical protein